MIHIKQRIDKMMFFQNAHDLRMGLMAKDKLSDNRTAENGSKVTAPPCTENSGGLNLADPEYAMETDVSTQQ